MSRERIKDLSRRGVITFDLSNSKDISKERKKKIENILDLFKKELLCQKYKNNLK